MPCPAGRFVLGLAGATDCAACPRGYFRSGSDINTSRCEMCTVGMHQNQTGQASCLPCIPGRVNNREGQAQCSDCGESTYAPTSGSVLCLSCGPGDGADPGSARCRSRCFAGEHVNDTINGTCQLCQIGRYRTSAMSTANCAPCPKGYHQDSMGQTSCLPCIPGRANNYPGQMTCDTCHGTWDMGHIEGGEQSIKISGP